MHRGTHGALRRAMAVMAMVIIATATLLAAPPLAAQQRNPAQVIGETVADRSSAHYRFERP